MRESVSKNLGHQNFYKMNHKWKDDCCTECGCKREKRHRVVSTYSKLTRSGIFEDRPVYGDYPEWSFSFTGTQWTFQRPDCVRKNDDRVQGDARISEANSC